MSADQLEDLPFEHAEFAARVDRVRAEMAKRALDTLILTSPENLYYLTGYSTPAYYATQALILPLSKDPVMLVYASEVDNVTYGSWLGEPASYGPNDDPMTVLAETIRAHALAEGRIGIETLSWFLPIGRYRELERALNRELTAADGLAEACRAIKSISEVKYIRRAADIASAAMDAVLDTIAPGVSENDIAATIYARSLELGGEYPGSPPYVSVGGRVCKPHASWAGRQIQASDQVYVELSACVARYSAALMRTFVVGDAVAPELLELEGAIAAGLSRVIAEMRPGMTSSAVDALCRDVVASGGFTYPHETGYSIGVCYPPGWNETHVFNLKPEDERPLREMMVLHLVPHTIIRGVGTIGLSETVLVKANGCEVLTSFPRRLTHV
jgi:Xaa-Pro dipeptidase